VGRAGDSFSGHGYDPVVPDIYTRTGDDGTTGLLYGKRVPKNHPMIEANGAVDEAQAVIGVARAEAEKGSELDVLLVGVERDLWVLMAELATAREDRHKLKPGTSLVTAEMVSSLENHIDYLKGRSEIPADFVVPGENRVSALLDQARAVVRRAERLVVALEDLEETGGGPPRDSEVRPYLNRLSDLLWTASRWQEGVHLLARTEPRRKRTS
jgi:cob(I)alamin adenosyltransferase